MSDPTETTIIGACGEHLINLTGWGDGSVYLSLWKPIASKEWGRLHWVWQSLRGRWSGDTELVLDREDVTTLRDALSAHLLDMERTGDEDA